MTATTIAAPTPSRMLRPNEVWKNDGCPVGEVRRSSAAAAMLVSESDTPNVCEQFPRLAQGMGLNHNYGGAGRESIAETERGLVVCSARNGACAVLL
jgi:hypothetical protein